MDRKRESTMPIICKDNGHLTRTSEHLFHFGLSFLVNFSFQKNKFQMCTEDWN